MNWIDGVLIALLLVAVVIGSKKGPIRELMAFLIFFASIIIAVNYIDRVAIWLHEQLGGSPLVAAFLAFAVLLAGAYGVFKLGGLVFYKVASLKTVSKHDQLGGALIGFVRGWLAVAFLVLMVFLLPLPEKFYTSFEGSFFGPAAARTIPMLFETTSRVHPGRKSFMQQIESSLLAESDDAGRARSLSENKAEVYRVLYQIDRFFGSKEAAKK